MVKKFIRMNNNNNQLSLGNFIKIVKNNSLNKQLSNQSDIFCIIFDIDDVNESTVNNYCIGARSISNEYKKIYIKIKNEYKNNKKQIQKIIGNISNIINGILNEDTKIEDINKNTNLKKVCVTLYNISKNDKAVTKEFSDKIKEYIDKCDLYNCIREALIYIVLEHKQPIYISDKINEKIETFLYNTNISFESLEEFINMHFEDGINYDYTVRKLAKKNNPYALFEMGMSEYSGKMTGTPRYNKAFEYFATSAKYNHPRAKYIAGRMLLEGKVGNQTKEEIEQGLTYLKQAEKLNNIASLNVLGKYYMNNDIEKAKKYFKKAAEHNYVYAYNNLGKIYELEENYEKALEYYLKSADLEESWACNKVGEMYRLGIGTKIDLLKALEYYNKALNAQIEYIENYAKYNLAKYFYMNGNYKINIEKDEEKAIKLLKESSFKVIESSIELIYYYIKNNNLEQLNEYIKITEHHPKFNNEYKKLIENNVKKIKEKQFLNIETEQRFKNKF